MRKKYNENVSNLGTNMLRRIVARIPTSGKQEILGTSKYGAVL